MESIIKELWHGNIIPQEDSRTNSKEMKELLGYMARHHEDESTYIPIVLTASYGLRRSKALGLSWDHIDFERKEIHICQKVMEIKQKGKTRLVISDEMKTEGSRRTLPLIPDVLSVKRISEIISYSDRTIRWHIAKGRLFVTLKENKHLVSKFSPIKFLASDKGFDMQPKSEWHEKAIRWFIEVMHK